MYFLFFNNNEKVNAFNIKKCPTFKTTGYQKIFTSKKKLFCSDMGCKIENKFS